MRLRVGNKAGVSTAEATVTVFGPPVPEFHMQAIGLRVIYWDKSTGEPTSWRWTSETGETSTEQNPEITFEEPGTYDMTLVVANAAGESSPLTRSITVYDQPEADYRYEELFLTVRFTNRSEGGPTAYLWDFGDGTSSTEENPSHDYAEPGSYDVTLTVSNPTGEDSLTRTIRIDAEPLEADFRCDFDDDIIVCDASPTTGATSYAWSAPGATSIDGRNEVVARFDFPPCGRFTILLEVANDRGDVDDKTRRTPDLGNNRVPEIERVRIESNQDLIVELRARAAHEPESWSWSIPGGEIVEGAGTATPTVRFEEAGSYEGVVTASNVCGVSEPFSFELDVEGPDPGRAAD